MEGIEQLDMTKETENKNGNSEAMKFPFLIFRLQQKYYAINCGLVSNIMKLPNYVVKTPCPSQYVHGIFELREEFIPIIALRTLFHMSDLDMERFEFANQLDQGIASHLHWAEELRNCVDEDRPFTLSLDFHQCVFGKWLDKYEANSYAIKTQFDKINVIHEALHKVATSILKKIKDTEEDRREAVIEEVFQDLHSNYISKVINLLEEMKVLHNDSILEMLIVIDCGNRHLAVIADEIISVENMDSEYSIENMQQYDASGYIAGVRHSTSLNADVLVVDETVLIDTILSLI